MTGRATTTRAARDLTDYRAEATCEMLTDYSVRRQIEAYNILVDALRAMDLCAAVRRSDYERLRIETLTLRELARG